MYKKLLAILMLIFSFSVMAKDKLKIGVTLQPYYSFVANTVKDKAEVIPVVRLDKYDSHSYQPKPEDIKRINELDVIVVNGVGHDEFIFDILNAADRKKEIKVIYANKNVSLMPIAGSIRGEKVMNPHTFISITTSIQQVYNIAKELGEIDPANKEFYLKNSRDYAKKLRKLKADALNEVKKLGNIDIRVATLHGGYDYLLSEFGIDVKAVIEPSHGAQPSAADLEKVIKIIKNEKIDIIFGEKNFNNKFVDTIHKETGVEVRSLSHMTNGAYELDGFEKFIKVDLDEVVKAIKDVAAKKGKK
ncbi:metal ABC transporter solute-binding protein, Zn/Mn family [Fusobacterium periodonticum]|uniref:Cation ABC transporter, periplasmic cation-binding protein n=1 Tax=Fusobacterium periodonticum 1_1_41FAA TaxID=469621 RepID=D6LJ45_9FUSO|nr:zinc ABC transporter substrate-binding protein [Fusobacterium periodonticum]EFG28421.1 ABC transporter, substrate-binding protein [Fusobacterium periodonticum 1_1_41FAA]